MYYTARAQRIGWQPLLVEELAHARRWLLQCWCQLAGCAGQQIFERCARCDRRYGVNHSDGVLKQIGYFGWHRCGHCKRKMRFSTSLLHRKCWRAMQNVDR